jgi:hypothetical protein
LPSDNHSWVRHDLTDAGWRGRMLARHLALMIPLCVLLGLLPAEWGIRVAVAALALLGSTFVVVINFSDIRQARLRQHGLPVPDDPQRGHPPH